MSKDGQEQDKQEQQRQQVGLCLDCTHTHHVVSAKGSQFFYCRRAETDFRYPKYPRLPVFACPGYQRCSER